MRGDDRQLQTGMFSYVRLEERIPAHHPLRGVRKLVDAVLTEMSKDFDGLYSQVGRPSIAPERLLRALLLQVFYSVRSERLRMHVRSAETAQLVGGMVSFPDFVNSGITISTDDISDTRNGARRI